MKKIKLLNAYGGIGGNRKHWDSSLFEITAIEQNESIANVYANYFPQDTIIVTDAHQFIRKYYKNYDIIWASPPCPSHTRLNTTMVSQGREIEYPAMELYQEIIYLRTFHKGLFVIENVIPYYPPLIQPTRILDRHYWWANFYIPDIKISRGKGQLLADLTIQEYEKLLGFHLEKFKITGARKLQVLRNCVLPLTGLHIINAALAQLEFKKGLF